MVDASKTGAYEQCRIARHKGANGALISGGSDLDGSIPYDKEDLERCLGMDGFVTNVHVGLISELKYNYRDAGSISVDIPPSDRVVREIYNLKDRSLSDYIGMLELFEEDGISYTPHICVGIEEGKVDGEFEVLEILQSYSCEQLVILSLKRTPFASMTKNRLNVTDYEKVLKSARDKFKYLNLGCMRDRDNGKESLWHYFDKIAWPSTIIKGELAKMGIDTREFDTCCSV